MARWYSGLRADVAVVRDCLVCGSLANDDCGEEDQEHDVFGRREFGRHGKKPEIQLCVQADRGFGPSLRSRLD